MIILCDLGRCVNLREYGLVKSVFLLVVVGVPLIPTRLANVEGRAASPTRGSMLPPAALASKIVYHYLANGEGLYGSTLSN